MGSRVFQIPIGAALIAVAAAAIVAGCGQQAGRRSSVRATRGGDADAYVRSVAATLNDLAANVDLELLPAQPILTAANSNDGNEVRAVCIENPRFPDGVFNYLLLTDQNVDLTRLDIQSGDEVRYYANFDEESAERGIEQRKVIGLEVLRLDPANPQTGIIIKGGLTGPMTVPQRIEIWRRSQSRVDAIKSAFNQYVINRQPPMGWEPAPDKLAIQQVVERANQWLRNTPAPQEPWKSDPRITDLPAELREAKGVAPLLTVEQLRDGLFGDAEGRLLAEAAWCRDVSAWARRPAAGQSEAEAATELFDWTVRNIQLDRAEAPATVQFLWQALAYGHGTAAHRAWALAELCRHQRLDAVILQPKAATDGTTAPLLVGVLVGDDVLVFDPQLGLPLPGPDGGVATLAQLAADDGLLRKLDVPGGAAYPLSAEQLKQVRASIVASPLQLSQRSARLEGALKGDEFIQLSVDAGPIAERLAKQPQIAEAALWDRPFKAIADAYTLPIQVRRQAAEEFQPFAQRPLLWQARLLHFQGTKDVRSAERDDPLAEPRDGHREALRLYQQPSVRPSDAKIAKAAEDKRAAYAAAKADASLWLGLLSYDLGNYNIAAVDWLEPLSRSQVPDGRWADAVQYNLARTQEALGRSGEAIKLLEATDARSPQRHGNLLRATRLASERPIGPPAP
jgi:hypothetical protein